MRQILITTVLALAANPSPAADGRPENRTCVCGKPVDPRIELVVIRVGDGPDQYRHQYGVCSVECAAKLKAMLPAEAVKAVEAANRRK